MRGLNLSDVQARLDQRLSRASTAPIAVGFSGGGDSLALLLLAKLWADKAGRRLLALTVDHQLNPQSRAWTAQAAGVAAGLGVDWRGLVWTGEKPAAGLPQAARRARHRLLAKAARDAGAHVVLLGHTADDVAEAAIIRQATPGLGRLTDWSPSPVWPDGRDIFLSRPLLDCGREALRVWLIAQGRTWLEDPGNADPRFARTRARRLLAERSVDPSDPFNDVGVSAADRALALAFGVSGDGRLCLARNSAYIADPTALRRALSVALVCTSGGERPPRGEALDRLLAQLVASPSPTSHTTATLAGARIHWNDDLIELGREAGRAAITPLTLAAGEGGVFDGRFYVEAEVDATLVSLAGRMGRLAKRDRAKALGAPAWARGVLPVMRGEGDALHLPRLLGDGPARVRSLVWRRFAAALGLFATEAHLVQGLDMAPEHVSSYVPLSELVC